MGILNLKKLKTKKEKNNMTEKEYSSKMSQKAIAKAMRMARHVGIENKGCYSRQIGTIITDDDGILLSVGYNSPPRKVPHTDTKEYIEEFLWPALTSDEKYDLSEKAFKSLTPNTRAYLKGRYNNGEEDVLNPKNITSFVYTGCKTCPRKLLGYGNGQRSELCSCIHSEINAIINAPGPLKGGNLFCWCNVLSCINCTGQIINAGIKEVHFLTGEEYQSGALWLYEKAKIPVFRHSLEFVNDN